MYQGTNQPPTGTPLNKSHPLCSGLVSCLVMNEGAGQKLFDKTGYPYPIGALTNGAVFKTNQKGGGIFFDGTNDYIDLGDIDRLEPFSITICISFNSSKTSDYQMPICKDDLNVTANRSYFMQTIITTGVLDFSVWKSGTVGTTQGVDWQHAVSTTNVCDGKWHCIIGTWNGSTINLYVDGVNESSVGFSGGIKVSGTALQIGKSQHSSVFRYFSGNMNYVMIYNRGLTATEARQFTLNPYQMFQQARPLKLAV